MAAPVTYPSILRTPYAHMGYVGSVQLRDLPSTTKPINVRVTSCDIKASQDITYPEVIDGRIDTTLFQVAPLIVGGNMAFPLVHEGAVVQGSGSSASCSSTSDSLAKLLWQVAAERDGLGRMANPFKADIRYADNTAFTYPGCLVNSMTFTINQGEAVTVSSEVFGGVNNGEPRIDYAGGPGTFLSPARVVTWNDARIEIFGESGTEMLSGNSLREFTCMINNGLERIYTMNGQLSPQDIAPKKREVSGTLKILGMNVALDTQAYQNSSRFTAKSAISFGYCLGAGNTNPYWATAFFGVIFKLEEMALTTGIFETTTNWRATGDCDREYLATALGDKNLDITKYPATGAGGGYGASCAPSFPSFTTAPNT